MSLRVWAIADTHLSLANPKPMDIFGQHWKDHATKIRDNCVKLVAPNDLLLIPGDLSWAMKRQEAGQDLDFLASLPGRKIVCKGNHDYWWDSDRPLNHPGLYDTPFATDDNRVGIAGTRGWTRQALHAVTEQEQASWTRTVKRECTRLEKRLRPVSHCQHKIAIIHYPPLEEFAPILLGSGVELIAYGHLHLGGPESPLPESWHGMTCLCVAADRIRFVPRLLATIPD